MIQDLLEYFNPLDYIEIWLTIVFLIAFFMSYSSFPAIFNVSEAKHLMDEPNDRSIHSVKTPTLGGISIYLSLVLVITTTGALLDTKILLLLLGGLTILFFLGLKDDLLILSPKKKLFGQILAAGLLIVFTDTRILGFSGLFGITILPYWISVGFTFFVYLLLINAYNLIDGVDGLAGSLALFASAAFAFVFITIKDISMATIAVGLIGALLPFLRLNFSRTKKIFMGDTGSMIIGFLMAFFIVRFIGYTETHADSQFHISGPVLAFAIVFFPLIDTLRIFVVRIVVHKKSPFVADKNHLHHRFLELGYSHVRTTLSIVIINIIIVIFAYLMKDAEIHLQIILLLAIGSFLYAVFFIWNRVSHNFVKTEVYKETH
jgi:UDP-GlcNAc:undecaprenyl-phosphate GlcNAc-1-phosphate transferase